jgi:ABC-type lipoprotein release transport system permease subunit
VSRTQAVLNNILANVSGIKDATAEYSIFAQQGAMTLKAVDPEEWLRTAYYEAEWFSGATVQNAFDSLAADNDTIILERSVAKSYNLTVGDRISVEFENGTKALRVVGFFGPEPQDQAGGIFSFSSVQSYWSFIPMNLYAVPGNLTSASARILVKIDDGADGITVAENVRNVDAGVSYVDSFAEEREKSQTNAITTGALEVQQLGIVFAVLAASVGTTLISTVSMSERSREATIMSVKGLSYKQLVVMFLTENFALVTFATTLGIAVGLISVYGNISSSNTLTSGSLVVRHFLFPLDSTLLVTACVALIFAATILPVIIMSRKYVTKLERMVRLR